MNKDKKKHIRLNKLEFAVYAVVVLLTFILLSHIELLTHNFEREKVPQSLRELKQITRDIQRFRLKVGRLPGWLEEIPNELSLEELEFPRYKPGDRRYSPGEKPRDPWGYPYIYNHKGNKEDYVLLCEGDKIRRTQLKYLDKKLRLVSSNTYILLGLVIIPVIFLFIISLKWPKSEEIKKRAIRMCVNVVLIDIVAFGLWSWFVAIIIIIVGIQGL